MMKSIASILSIVLSISFLSFKVYAIDDKSESIISACSPKKSVKRLEDIIQSSLGQWIPAVYDRETVLQLPSPVLEDMIQRRQLPIEAPIITPELLTSLRDHVFWQDPWGYQWLTDLCYSDFALLLEQTYPIDVSLKNLGNQVYQYDTTVFYVDFDPVDYIEVTTSKYIKFSIKLNEKIMF